MCTFIFSQDATCPEPDGDITDGDITDGDEPDGDEPDGDATDGDTTDGDATDGDTTDGDTDTDVEPTCGANAVDCSGTCIPVVNLSYGESEAVTVNTCTGTNRYSTYTCDSTSGPGKEILFRWVADRSGSMILGTETVSDWDQMVFQLNSACSNSCSQFTDSEFGAAGVQEYFSFTATQGQSYYFAVDGFSSSECGTVKVGVSSQEDAGCETIGPIHYTTFALVFSSLLLYGLWLTRRRRDDSN